MTVPFPVIARLSSDNPPSSILRFIEDNSCNTSLLVNFIDRSGIVRVIVPNSHTALVLSENENHNSSFSNPKAVPCIET